MVHALRPIAALAAAALACVLAAGGTSTAADDRLDAIRKAGRFRACIWPDYYAISFRNPRDGKLSGVDVEMARELARELGVQVDFVNTTFASFVDDLTADRCDIAMFGIRLNNDRRNYVDFTSPHLRSGLYAVTTADNRLIRSWQDLDQPGRAIAVQSGSYLEGFMRDWLKAAQLVPVKPPAKREDELLAGRVDAFMTDYAYAQNMRFQHDWAKIIEPPQPVGVGDYAYAVAKGSPQWFARVNSFVEDVKRDGRLARAANANGVGAMVLGQ